MAKYLWFKTSGKYYTEGDGVDLPITGESYTRDKIRELNDGKMPGLSSSGDEFFLVIIEDEESYPRLFHPVEPTPIPLGEMPFMKYRP